MFPLAVRNTEHLYFSIQSNYPLLNTVGKGMLNCNFYPEGYERMLLLSKKKLYVCKGRASKKEKKNGLAFWAGQTSASSWKFTMWH